MSEIRTILDDLINADGERIEILTTLTAGGRDVELDALMDDDISVRRTAIKALRLAAESYILTLAEISAHNKHNTRRSTIVYSTQERLEAKCALTSLIDVIIDELTAHTCSGCMP